MRDLSGVLLNRNIVEPKKEVFHHATFSERASASIIDLGFLFVLFIPIYGVDYFTDNAITQGRVIGALTTLYLFIWLFVFIFYDSYAISTYGHTLGQKIAHIKVTSEDKKRPSFESAFARKILSSLLITKVWAFVDPQHRGLDETLTHTIIVEDDDKENDYEMDW